MQIRRLFFIFVLTAILLGGQSGFAAAQSDKSVVVRERSADLTISQNGDVRFVETWVVDFQKGPFTFAFREIPKNKLSDITAWSVREGDRVFQNSYGDYTFSVDETTDAYKITWRFPATNQREKFLSDPHTFELQYTVRGATRIDPQGDQFWWKFVEGDRAYPIEAARVTLHLPQEFSADQLKATTYVNAAQAGGARVRDGKTIEFSGGPFSPKMEWEIRAQFPHVLRGEPPEWQKWDDYVARVAAQNNFYATAAFIVILIGGPLLLLVLWYLFGRDKPTTFRAEFLPKPPDDTPPGVVGVLLDERADLQDIVATMVDLARRGYLQIRESDAFGAPEYARTAQSAADLAPFEKETLDALLQGNATQTLGDVRGAFYRHLQNLQNALYREAVARGYFAANPLATRDFYFRVGKWGALLVPPATVVAACALIVFAPLAFLPLCGLEILFLALLGLSRVMPQRTAKGATATAQWHAFKRYLAQLEKYENLKDAQTKFADYLPYAIAFGLEKTWIEKFKQTDAPAPTWYVPFGTTDAKRAAPDDWTWRNLDSTRADAAAPSSPPADQAPAPAAPLFHDSPPQSNAPNLDDLARGSFVSLNQVSGNMFDFLNSSASAFADRTQPTKTHSLVNGVSDVLDRLASTSSDSSSSSWSSSSDSSSWSSGSSGGGGGGGGGSSGFG